MEPLLLLILIIIGNLSLYWILFGKKKFEQKYSTAKEVIKEEHQDDGKTPSN